MPSYFNKLIEICDKCLCASCYHGEFICWDAQNAGTVIKPIKELMKLNKEHKSHWSAENLKRIYGCSAPHGYARSEHEERS